MWRKVVNLAPLLNAAPPIPLHAFAAMAAFALGAVQLAAPKGTLPHRTLGWICVALMAMVAVSVFGFRKMRVAGPWRPMPRLWVFALVVLPPGGGGEVGHEGAEHRRIMISLFLGALVIAGLFTLLPGRIMHDVAFG